MTHLNGTKRFATLLTLSVALGVSAISLPAGAQAGANQAGNGNGGAAGGGNGRQSYAQGAKRIGPAWRRWQDNAQSPNQLKRGMKLQERRQRHQYEQAMMQVKEQQQQQYEKDMLQTLGSQRPVIQQNREDIKAVRQATGANDK